MRPVTPAARTGLRIPQPGITASLAAVVTGLIHWATTRYLVTLERVYVRRGGTVRLNGSTQGY